MAIKLPNKNDIRCTNLMKTLKRQFISFLAKNKIDQIDQNFFEEIVIPIAVYLNSLEKQKKPRLIGLTGGQGSGKTTLSNFIQLVLKKDLNKICRFFNR